MFIIAIVIIVIAVLFGGMHKIEEGHVVIIFIFYYIQREFITLLAFYKKH